MNKRIDELFGKALDEAVPETWTTLNLAQLVRLKTKFAELIVEECRSVVVKVYRNTSLELCGPLLTADDEIEYHFYGEVDDKEYCPTCGAEWSGTSCGIDDCGWIVGDVE